MITKIKNIYHIRLLFTRQNHNMNICNRLLVLFGIKIRYVKLFLPMETTVSIRKKQCILI